MIFDALKNNSLFCQNKMKSTLFIVDYCFCKFNLLLRFHREVFYGKENGPTGAKENRDFLSNAHFASRKHKQIFNQI